MLLLNFVDFSDARYQLPRCQLSCQTFFCGLWKGTTGPLWRKSFHILSQPLSVLWFGQPWHSWKCWISYSIQCDISALIRAVHLQVVSHPNHFLNSFKCHFMPQYASSILTCRVFGHFADLSWASKCSADFSSREYQAVISTDQTCRWFYPIFRQPLQLAL